MTSTNIKSIFEKDYFSSHYYKTTGSFGLRELNRNKNWFYGWFNSLENEYTFKAGNGKKVLEIGCAIGAAADILGERGFNVLATDISSFAINKNKKLLPHIKFENMDIENVNNFKNKYDLIYAFEVIEHLGNPEAAFKNIYKLLKSKGSIILSTPYPYKYSILADKTHINVRYPLEWVILARKTGFLNVRYIYRTFIPFFYRFSKYLHFYFPFLIKCPYLNTHVFIIASK